MSRPNDLFQRPLLSGKNAKRGGRPREERGARDAPLVNIRTESKRARKVRHARNARSGLKAAAIVLGIIVIATAARAFIVKVYYQNPQFQLGRLYIETDGDLTRPAILRHSGIQREDNLLELDLERVRASLASLPQIAHVEVERQLPDIISIRVSERKPIAWLECPESGARPHSPGEGWLVDAGGNVFLCEGIDELHMDLPIIATDDLPPLIGRVKIEEGAMSAALRLIVLNEERFFQDQLEIDRIDCSRGYSMVAHYRNDASVIFSPEGLEGQLEDFAAILSYAKEERRQIATLNLMVEDNKPITFYNAPTGWEEERILAGQPDGEAAPEVEEKPATSKESDVRAILGSLY